MLHADRVATVVHVVVAHLVQVVCVGAEVVDHGGDVVGVACAEVVDHAVPVDVGEQDINRRFSMCRL